MYSQQIIEIPEHDFDLTLKFSSGKVIHLQHRPSNADTNYNGSFDIIMPEDVIICTFKGEELEPSETVGDLPNQHLCQQIVFEIPGPDQPTFV